MSAPATISVFKKSFHQVPTLEHFRYQEGRKVGARRIGLVYYVLYLEGNPPFQGGCPEGGGLLIQQTITADTDPNWLATAISAGHIYLEKVDFDITASAVASAKAGSKATEK